MALPATCPVCATDEFSTTDVTADGRTFAVCTGPSHPEPWEFEPMDPRSRSTRGDGLGRELGIWDKLLECVPIGQGAVPYGVVEDELFERYPGTADTLLRRYGHRFRNPEHRSGRYSMSAYLASRLRELEKEGALVLTWGPATGDWAYNGVISHWERL